MYCLWGDAFIICPRTLQQDTAPTQINVFIWSWWPLYVLSKKHQLSVLDRHTGLVLRDVNPQSELFASSDVEAQTVVVRRGEEVNDAAEGAVRAGLWRRAPALLYHHPPVNQIHPTHTHKHTPAKTFTYAVFCLSAGLRPASIGESNSHKGQSGNPSTAATWNQDTVYPKRQITSVRDSQVTRLHKTRVMQRSVGNNKAVVHIFNQNKLLQFGKAVVMKTVDVRYHFGRLNSAAHPLWLTMWSSPWSSGCRGSCPPASPPSSACCFPSAPSQRCSWWCSPGWPRSPPPAYRPQSAQPALHTQVGLSMIHESKMSHGKQRLTRCKISSLPMWETRSQPPSLLTCRAVVLHLADKYAESVFRAPADAETQTSIWAFIYCHCVKVFTVIPSCKHTKKCTVFNCQNSALWHT